MKQTYEITTDFRKTIVAARGKAEVSKDKWMKITLSVKQDKAQIVINGKSEKADIANSPKNGFVGYGAISHAIVDFDNFLVEESKI